MRMNLLSDLQASILVRLPLTVYCQVINMRNRIRGKAHRISPFEGNHILKAYDATDEIFLCRRILHNRYRHGIRARIDKLAKEYHLDHVPTKPGGFLSIAVQILANWGFGLSPGEWTMLPSSPSLLRPAVSI